MTIMDRGMVQRLRVETVSVTKAGNGTGTSMRNRPRKTAMMQGCFTSFLKASFLSTSVNKASPAVHMVKRSGIWKMDTYITPRLPKRASVIGMPTKLELEQIMP